MQQQPHVFCFQRRWLWLLMLLASCSTQRQIQQLAHRQLATAEAFDKAHWGVSILALDANRYWYNQNGQKYFVPASNVKIPTCYVAMKHLGDRLPAAMVKETTDTLFVQPSGDPSFLHPDFPVQPLLQKMRETNKHVALVYSTRDRFQAYGSGWSWDDYQEPYLAERSALPLYGNLVYFEARDQRLYALPSVALRPPFCKEPMMQLLGSGGKFTMSRSQDKNIFSINRGNKTFGKTSIPFKTDNGVTNFIFLQDTLQQLGLTASVRLQHEPVAGQLLFSQPTDSLLRPLMHRSDNFFAEQSLLMVSQRLLGYMSDRALIDTMLAADLAGLPQPPRWVDGSGLSRYNLFSPQDMVTILYRMQREFGWGRIQNIFPSGNQGTLSGYYVSDSASIYAKTGTLSGVVALSGFLQTKKGKWLAFSVMVNNHQTTAAAIRRQIEKFLVDLRARY
ncbi:MAG: D-alanyl-D-alanine carboxypeptidase/D-alanyl-D-alanine-endopeptidase [Chitinophagia bacterium]|nr:D-alanyl-D-alanine carboxypeptidase/D-alanyl-D-alanine-endopeptidase [Chitinophagia bacterium]